MLEVNGLSKKFNESYAVNNLSFSVNQGDVYGFLGQNGAGKSTTLRMILGLIKPTAGRVSYFQSNNLITLLQESGAVIEKPDMYKYLSAYDNLSIFSRLSGAKSSRKQLMEQLDVAGLAQRAHSKVKTFSQGMKQRLGIAVALTHDPKLVILDEPANGLDPQGIADLRDMIKALSVSGKTIIVSSHLLHEIEQVANRMLIIHKGKKIAEGAVSSLLDPANTLVDADTKNNAAAFVKLKENMPRLKAEIFNKKIRMHLHKDDLPAMASRLASEAEGLLSFVPQHSLEDYFLSLTNQHEDVQPATN